MIIVHNHPASMALEEKQKKLSEINHACLTSILRLRETKKYIILPRLAHENVLSGLSA
jgi:hypothetical protein